MNNSIREIAEGLQEQGVNEVITYTLDATKWGGATSPSSPDVKVYSVTEGDAPAYNDVTSTIIPSGSPSVSGQIITLPQIRAMTEGVLYRVQIKFNKGADVFDPYAEIRCKR